jgi:hypothetical protein
MGIAILVAVVSGWGGYELASGHAAGRELRIAEAYVANQNAAVDAVRQQLAAQSARATQRAKREAVSEGRRVREAADYELQIARSARVECARDDGLHDRLLTAIRAANAAIGGEALELPEGVPTDAGAR